ncbi:MAG: 4-hydroxy-3-methylbut-2-enyl diphosphate reductase [Bacteroidales bacterium]|nr:4-hydroxy-3-methylbut-2-enyl diphosphate reductase [Bacteroidales bacterium]
MAASVEIDPHSGFCGGVIRAVSTAEKFLATHSGTKLFSLGAIVHNEEELERLSSSGLVAIDYGDLEEISNGKGEYLMIRAHGEPPKTYQTASGLGFEIIDCTCPVVLRLQKEIRESYGRIKSMTPQGQILIFGKIGHAEVLGLLGQIEGDAVVIESVSALAGLERQGKIDYSVPSEIFSQTTKSPAEYAEVCRLINGKMSAPLVVHDTICVQVASRYEKLVEFARNHDVLIFVAGKSSSNGTVLCDLCRSVNIRTYRIVSPQEFRPEWVGENDRIGVCGATSTPAWLLEKVAAYIENFAR